MKIAVVGSGISGLSAAYFLSKKYKVDLFEKEDHFGGHSYTINIQYDKKNNKNISADVGFIVFNYETYPNLISFFKENKIDFEKSNMSFSVSVKDTDIEYCGSGLNGIFSNRINLFRAKFLKMFFEIVSFYKRSSKLKDISESETLGDFLEKNKFSNFFINYHIIPMVSAIWSMPPNEAKLMPLNFFVNFFQNHGLFKLKKRPQWYTVSNRSKTYVNKVLGKISGEHFKNYKVNKIKRNPHGVEIYYGDKSEFFTYDKVILATHADEALALIENPLDQEKDILSKFGYKKNVAIIHTDEIAMPKNRKIWSSWNSSIDKIDTQKNSITYWLNLLQNFKINKNIFLTLNPFFKIDKNKILKKIDFMHPYYNYETLINQKRLNLLQNKKNILFCGSYFGYGFHEDGIKSSIDMIKFLND